jgi:hypothetical protein
MNAIPSFDASKFSEATFGATRKVLSEAAENLQVVTGSLVTGMQDLERARAEVLAIGVKALQQQATGFEALAKATGPQEALELQQQFAKQALETHNATVQAFRGLAVAWTEAFKPLKARYVDIAVSATKP